MGARWLAMTLAAILLWTAGQTMGQTTQPDSRSAPTTQPEGQAVPLPVPLPQTKPIVTGVGPVVPGEGTRENELAPPPATDASAPQEPAGVPPPMPTADELIRALRKGESGLAAQPGVPRAQDVTEDLKVDARVFVVSPTQPTAESAAVPLESVRPETRQKLLPEGFAVRDSVGFLVRDQGRWLFVFEADSSGAGADPPLILLPNSHLESMISQSQSGQAKIKFRVTGEVTQFRQTNYLLLRKTLVEHNLDRF